MVLKQAVVYTRKMERLNRALEGGMKMGKVRKKTKAVIVPKFSETLHVF